MKKIRVTMEYLIRSNIKDIILNKAELEKIERRIDEKHANPRTQNS